MLLALYFLCNNFSDPLLFGLRRHTDWYRQKRFFIELEIGSLHLPLMLQPISYEPRDLLPESALDLR